MDKDAVANLVPIVGEMIPLASIIFGVAVAFWAMYLSHQRRRMQFEERRLMIEKGMTPPPLPVETRVRSPQATLRVGIMLLFLGFGFGLAYAIVQGPEIFNQPRGFARALAIAGSIVAMLGVGNMVYYAIARKDLSPSLPPAA
jgi:hypothetical protein